MGSVLGVRTGQINRNFNYPSVTDNQLRAWNHIGLFSTDIGEATQYTALTDPADTSASISNRARSYLAANCAQCHTPNGPTPVDLDLRADTPTNTTNLINVTPTNGDLGLANARRVTSGSKESSVLWERMRSLDANRMPPLGSNIVDATGVNVVGEWIDAGAH